MKTLLLFVFAGVLLAQPPAPKFPAATVGWQDLMVAKDLSSSVLASDITASQTDFNVGDGTRFTPYQMLTVGTEHILICGVAGNMLTVCISGRGVDGTTAAIHTGGTPIRGNVTSGQLNRFAAEIKAIQEALGPNLSNTLSTSGNFINPAWLSNISASIIGNKSVDNTKFGYLSNVTSDVQAQLNNHAGCSGDLVGTPPNCTVAKLNGTPLSGLASGILKNTTGTGVPSIAAAVDFPVLNQPTTSTAGGLTGTALTGDVSNSGNALTIAPNAVGSPKLAVVNTRRTVCMTQLNGSGVLANADLGPLSRLFFVPGDWTLVELTVAADLGTPNIIVGRSHAGSIMNLTTAPLSTAAAGGIACAKTTAVTSLDGVTTCSATLQNTSFAAGDWVTFVSGTAGGAAHQVTVCPTWVVN